MAIFRASATYPRENLRQIFKRKDISIADIRNPFDYFKSLHPITNLIDIEIMSGIAGFVCQDLGVSEFTGTYGSLKLNGQHKCTITPKLGFNPEPQIIIYNFHNSGVASLSIVFNGEIIYTGTSRNGGPYLNLEGFSEAIIKSTMNVFAEILTSIFRDVKSGAMKVEW